MKKFSMLLLSVLLASYSLAVADTGNFEIGNFVIISNDSDKLYLEESSVIPLGPAYGMDDSKPSVKSDFYEIQLLASLPRQSDELGFSLDSSTSQFSVNLVKKYSPVKFEYGYGVLRPLQFFDVTGSGGGLLSIAASIKNERNSVPETSTMLLLGLGLVGLAGYGGRKKFKR